MLKTVTSGWLALPPHPIPPSLSHSIPSDPTGRRTPHLRELQELKLLSLPAVNSVTLVILGYLLVNLEDLRANQFGMGFPGDGVMEIPWLQELWLFCPPCALLLPMMADPKSSGIAGRRWLR